MGRLEGAEQKFTLCTEKYTWKKLKLNHRYNERKKWTQEKRVNGLICDVEERGDDSCLRRREKN